MRAAIIEHPGAAPTLTEIDPPAADQDVAVVVAAALNPVDLVVAAGTMPFRPLTPGAVAGIEGVARTADGELRYFFTPPAPYGALAELVPLAGAETAPVPEGLDPAAAAALGISGLAAWLPLASSSVSADDTVLVLGADGAVGRLAMQFARVLGAGRVVGVARGEAALARVTALGADRAVSSDDPGTLADRLREAAPGGVDVIVDTLWGPVAGPAVAAARPRARYVQIGNAAGPDATLSAPVFRNKLMTLTGHSNFAATPAERISAYRTISAHAARGDVSIEVETVPLDDVADAWSRLATGRGARAKLVVLP